MLLGMLKTILTIFVFIGALGLAVIFAHILAEITVKVSKSHRHKK